MKTWKMKNGSRAMYLLHILVLYCALVLLYTFPELGKFWSCSCSSSSVLVACLGAEWVDSCMDRYDHGTWRRRSVVLCCVVSSLHERMIWSRVGRCNSKARWRMKSTYLTGITEKRKERKEEKSSWAMRCDWEWVSLSPFLALWSCVLY